MNKLNYYLLKKINISTPLDENLISDLYKIYEDGSERFKYKIQISKEEFKKILISIYEVMELTITKDEYKEIATNYIALLMADAYEGNDVNLNWAIDHIWYFAYGGISKKLLSKYKECIPFIQDKLIKEFSICESPKEHLKRRFCIKLMAR